jgi:hypothetical protein
MPNQTAQTAQRAAWQRLWRVLLAPSQRKAGDSPEGPRHPEERQDGGDTDG